MSSNLVEDENQNMEEEQDEEFPSYDPQCLTYAYEELLPPKCQNTETPDQPSICKEVNPLSNNKLIPPCDRLKNEGLCHVTDSQRDAINSVSKCDEYCKSFNEDYNDTKSLMCDSCNCYRTGSLHGGPEEETQPDKKKKQKLLQENQSPLAKMDKNRNSSVFRAWMTMLFSIILLIVALAFYQTNV